MKDIYIVGIAGGSASGKTTIVERIRETFGEQILIIGHDSYYRAHTDMPFEERCNLNYDHPDAFETELLCEHVRMLKQGKAVEQPVYDYSNHNRSTETVYLEPRPIILLEGILVLENPELRSLMDLKVFVDTDADERIMRRLSRDIMERGRSFDSVMTQYRNTVKPMHDKFVEPTKYTADIIIPWGGSNVAGIDVLMQYLRIRLQERL